MVSPLDKSVRAGKLIRAEKILREIAKNRGQDFTGVGVVFYQSLDYLPHLQLNNNAMKPSPESFVDEDLATALASISITSSPLHDGFHFIETRSWRLSHLSQFISPPIPSTAAQLRGSGARLMAALLASMLPGIVCVGLVSHGGEIHLFSNGSDATQKD